MKLRVNKREGSNKAEINRIRREGDIPAVLYSHGKDAINVNVNGSDFQAALRQIKSGQLSTTKFSLEIEGKVVPAIVKDIQYHVTSYNILHLDFEELVAGKEINVKVPIICTGVVDCVGVKLGGFLRQVIRQVKIRTTPDKIPTEFEINVQDLGIKDTRRLRDLALPAGVHPLAKMDEVVVVVAKR